MQRSRQSHGSGAPVDSPVSARGGDVVGLPIVAELLDGVDVGLAGLDEHGAITSWSAGVRHLTGCGPAEAIGRPVEDVLGVMADRTGHGDRLRRALAGDRNAGTQVSLRRDDGRDVVAHVLASTTEGGTVVVLRDITERIEARQVLADVRRRVRDLEALGRMGLWHWDRRTQYLRWSPQLFEIHGVDDPTRFDGSVDAHIGRVREDRRDDVRNGLFRAVSVGTRYETEYPAITDDGQERWCHLRADPVIGADGEVQGLTGIVQDVTETREALRATQDARADLERFAATVAHDLKEPLTSMLSFAQILVEEAKLEEPFARYARRLEANAASAADLVRDILLESRRPRAAGTAAIALGDVVVWAVETLRERLERTGSTVEVAEPLPTVAGSEVLLRQVVLNLVGNAVKYRHTGQPVMIAISGAREEGTATLLVEDDGPGIPVDVRDQVFEDGFRAERDVDRGIEGTGIGLATVRAAIQRSGGEISLEDSPLGGARFVVRLPAAPAGAARR